MTFRFQQMDEYSARCVVAWQYDPPYDCYTFDPALTEKLVTFFAEPRNAYHSITDETGALVAFCCLGAEARVPGGAYHHAALDLGLGVRPDLTGQGRGASIVAALIGFARRTVALSALRVTVAEFNQRALHVWRHAGFLDVEHFRRERDGKAFVILLHQETAA